MFCINIVFSKYSISNNFPVASERVLFVAEKASALFPGNLGNLADGDFSILAADNIGVNLFEFPHVASASSFAAFFGIAKLTEMQVVDPNPF